MVEDQCIYGVVCRLNIEALTSLRGDQINIRSKQGSYLLLNQSKDRRLKLIWDPKNIFGSYKYMINVRQGGEVILSQISDRSDQVPNFRSQRKSICPRFDLFWEQTSPTHQCPWSSKRTGTVPGSCRRRNRRRSVSDTVPIETFSWSDHYLSQPTSFSPFKGRWTGGATQKMR